MSEGQPVVGTVGGASAVSTPVRNSHDRAPAGKGPVAGLFKSPAPASGWGMEAPSSSAPAASARKKAKVSAAPSPAAAELQGPPSTSNGAGVTPVSKGTARKQSLPKSVQRMTPKPSSAESQFEFKFAPLGVSEQQQQDQSKPKSALKAAKPSSDGKQSFLGAVPVRSSSADTGKGSVSKATTPSGKTPTVVIQAAATERPGGSQVKSVVQGSMTAGKSQLKTSAKKRVKIDLRQNLVHAFGGPVPPPDVRTPSRVTGGILKVKAAPSSAPAKVGGRSEANGDRFGQPGGGGGHRQQQQARAGSASVGKQQLQPGTGNAARGATPRAKAALFF